MPEKQSPPSISVIICTLNEERCLPHVLMRIPDYVSEIVLVDGRSTDRTVDVARKFRPDIRVVYQDGTGRGNALLCGIRSASQDYCLFLDGDGSQKPEDLDRLVAVARQGYDVVKASRYLLGGGSQDETLTRRLCIWLACRIANLLWGTHFTDVAYGLCLARREALLALDLHAQGFDFEWELAAKAARKGFRIAEVPCTEAARLAGESKLSVLRHGWPIAMRVFAEFWDRLRIRGSSAKDTGPSL